jgi:hypothetical protein
MPEPITAILFRRVGAMEVKAIFPVCSSLFFVKRYGPRLAPDQTDPSRALARMETDVRAGADLTDAPSMAAAHG